MSVGDLRVIFWSVFASCAGIITIVLLNLIEYGAAGLGAEVAMIVLIFEITGAVFAGMKLKWSYAQHPLPWPGRWQFALSDLLSIVVFFAAVMTIARAIDPDKFPRCGLPVAALLGIGYAIALLCVAKMGHWKNALVRWSIAVGYLFRALFICAFSIILQFCFLGFVFGIIGSVISVFFVLRSR